MENLRRLVGIERDLGNAAQTLHFFAAALRPPVVGAVHVTCADETEHECVNAFQRGFVQYYVPPVKFAELSAFRIANLGGRYEWGAVRIAEQHFATPESDGRYKLLVVKINAHVAITNDDEGPRFGSFHRYGRRSPCCGALHGLLHGEHQPWVEALRELFTSEGKDRIATLLDDHRIPPRLRALHAALASARLQARKAILDVQDYESLTPTLYVVIPSVTINRPDRDSEIISGIYTADDREPERRVEYYGLGDDPAGYRISQSHGRHSVEDDELGTVRPARDHRQLVMTDWRAQRRRPIEDDRFDQISRDATVARRGDQAKKLLGALLPLLAEITPVSAAVLLFSQGTAGVHHAFRAQRLARRLEGDVEARAILAEVREKVEKLDPKQAQAILELLVREHGR